MYVTYICRIHACNYISMASTFDLESNEYSGSYFKNNIFFKKYPAGYNNQSLVSNPNPHHNKENICYYSEKQNDLVWTLLTHISTCVLSTM